MARVQTFMSRSVGDDPIQVDHLPSSDVIEVIAGRERNQTVYLFDVVAHHYKTDRPTAVRPTDMIWSDVATDERDRGAIKALPAVILAALADCDLTLEVAR